MEYQKITNLLGTTLDEVLRFITKKWVEVHDKSSQVVLMVDKNQANK